MLKNDIIIVKISSKNRAHYRTILNNNINVGDEIEIESNKIPKSSHTIITAICDFCYLERKIMYKEYNKQTNNGLFKFTCSKKCVLEKTKETNLIKFGVINTFQSEEFKKTIKLTKLEKYGNENYNNRKSTEETNIEKYGFKCASSSESIKNKTKLTNIKKFGFDTPIKNEQIFEKMKKTCFDRWGFDNFSKTEEFKTKLQEKWFDTMYLRMQQYGILKDINCDGVHTIICSDCGNIFSIQQTMRNIRIRKGETICTKCNPLNQSLKQKEVYDFIKEYEKNIIYDDRKVLDGKELDIYIPDLKLAFEFNGLYWHSELFLKRNAHINKTKICERNGIKLFHIWEDDWKYKQDIIKSMILNKLNKSEKIFARKCQIKSVENRMVRDFLTKNHIQGFVGSKVKLGLFYNNELVSLMTFGNLRKSLGQTSQKNSYELLRFCNILNTSVIGGASKLFNHFIRFYDVNEVISYSDSSRGDGNMYSKLNFNLEHETSVNYYWVVNGIRYHRFNFRKDKLVKEGNDPDKTEIEIMHNKGYYRIFDCGCKKFRFINRFSSGI